MFLKNFGRKLKNITPFKTPMSVNKTMARLYGDTIPNRLGIATKKVVNSKNITGVAATGATMYGGNKMYNHIREKRRKWWEIL